MPRRRRYSKRRVGGEPTETEWAWLTAAPDCNPFIGFGDSRICSPARIAELWREHRAEIMRLLRADPPARLPYGHPARDERA